MRKFDDFDPKFLKQVPGPVYKTELTNEQWVNAEKARLEGLLEALIKFNANHKITQRQKDAMGVADAIKAVQSKIRRVDEGDRMVIWMSSQTLMALKKASEEECMMATLPTMDDVMGTAVPMFMGWAIWIDDSIEPRQIEFSVALTKHHEEAAGRSAAAMAAAAKFEQLMTDGKE